MNTWARGVRHLRLMSRNYSAGSPPFLILFINSICNQTCEHCFYWRNLNRPDDLTFDELRALSNDLGHIENLNLSGGEPFLRKEFGEICRMFIRTNHVKQIYVPTNGSFPDRTVRAVEDTLREPGLELFAVELSLDGTPEFHNTFRGMKDAFERAMETYDVLAELQQRDVRLRIHAISTAMATNLVEIRNLTVLLHARCAAMDHHNIALIRGDRKNPSLKGPALEQYRQLYDFVRLLWARREANRYGSVVEPMLQWAKTRTSEEQRQVVPCRAGILSGVIYSNGDVSVCETHQPIGNLRERPFSEIWRSEKAQEIRKAIAAKQCWCTNEVFLWPSIVYPPAQLVRALAQSKTWRTAEPPSGITGPPASTGAGQSALKVLQ